MAAAERLICDSSALTEGGSGVRFAVSPSAEEAKGFVVRHRGRACAFVNRCPHVGTELDWEPGEFFEAAGLYLVCSTHGALFEPASGLCVAGPCRGTSLQPIAIRERDGQVFVVDNEPGKENAAP